MQSGTLVRSLVRASHLGQCGIPLLCGSVRHLSREIGQPTNFTHPELIGEGESKYILTLSLHMFKSFFAPVLPGIHKSEFAERRSNLIK